MGVRFAVDDGAAPEVETEEGGRAGATRHRLEGEVGLAHAGWSGVAGEDSGRIAWPFS
jgi:hypothetical protein